MSPTARRLGTLAPSEATYAAFFLGFVARRGKAHRPKQQKSTDFVSGAAAQPVLCLLLVNEAHAGLKKIDPTATNAYECRSDGQKQRWPERAGKMRSYNVSINK